MRAVSNTSPISNLAFIGRLSLLKRNFSETWIPPSVLEELGAHPDAAALSAIRTAISEKRIQIARPSTSPLLKILSPHLHPGEAEAIALAVETKADIVIIDEQEGRKFAAQCSSAGHRGSWYSSSRQEKWTDINHCTGDQAPEKQGPFLRRGES